MNAAAPNTLDVTFYDGRAPAGQPATLIWSGSTVKLIGAAIAQGYPTSALRVSPRIGTTDRFIALPDGGQLQSRDHPLLDRLPQEGKAEGIAAWLERRWPVALACLVLTLAGLAGGYFYGLPAAADRIAARVPIEYEQYLGDHTLGWLDEREWFQPSSLSADRRAALAEGFTRLSQDLPHAPHYRLEFRDAPDMGPNAFALPGGTIVITDQMVERAELPEEVYAILAHEIGHVERRHALRHILQNSVIAVVAATVTSDAASLTLAVSGLPVVLAQARYSRRFETEADDYGFALLERHAMSPAHFANFLERLSAEGDSALESRLSFLSTHPVTAERIARARAAAASDTQ